MGFVWYYLTKLRTIPKEEWGEEQYDVEGGNIWRGRNETEKKHFCNTHQIGTGDKTRIVLDFPSVHPFDKWWSMHLSKNPIWYEHLEIGAVVSAPSLFWNVVLKFACSLFMTRLYKIVNIPRALSTKALCESVPHKENVQCLNS